MRSVFLFISAVCGLSGVAMGAFGAHGLKTILSVEMMQVYKTAVDYHIWHALGLGLIALIQLHFPQAVLLKWAGWMMLIGIIFFSGSLYFLVLLELKWLGMITPLGGVYFILSWLLLAVFAFQSDDSKEFI
ncbi:MAG: DUF423 domain-containing protein [Methylococcales symbiont of Iophon sp. n. MRB-2018]|nr:MAG: DUF423 domain-containing protein [Methylococcales symbiont of Iophon sp. n. MRB-2018]KAF3979928.1 MAG: DUF423 domain-containing protein [Methylococcales symbiont of Iophon sp. n. MRB-2018]